MSRRGRALADLVHCLRAAEPPRAADWTQILALANEHLLAPALWSALDRSGRASTLPSDAAEYLAMLHRLNGERNDVLRRQAIELVGALNRHGIVPMLLKGGLALFDGPYADPAARMMRDLDVLVPVGARNDAIAVLGKLDYRLVQEYGADHHAFGDFARPNDPGSIDLHTELVDPSHVLPASEVWARAEPRAEDDVHGDVRFLAPCATDRVLHNLLHAQIHYLGNFYRGELQLQQAHELATLARRFGPAVDWRFVQQRLSEHRLTTALESHLLTAHRLFELDWPLPGRPTLAARLHHFRCELQFRVRSLQRIAVPWGNLRGAFAWHRMQALHGGAERAGRGGALRWRWHHLVGYLRKRGIGATVGRLLRQQ